MFNKDEIEKEKPCWFYIDDEPLSSFREVQTQLSSKEIPEKEIALRKILGSITNDDKYPDNLMMSAINYLTIVEDIRVKKLLFLFWEIIEKRYPNGKIREEFILVCNSLRKELTHPNEYVRGRVLRLLCKLPYFEILESLKSVIIENVTHKHAYVRKNALLCIVSITNNFGVDVLPESLKATLREIVEKDSDITCKRNAYLALSKIDQKESFEVTQELLTTTDINEIGDLFLLSLVENLRNICLNFPNLKGRIIKLFYDLANHKSHSVLFEVANSLISLSSNPQIIKTAVGIFCNLLVEQKDNNILIIILKKLIKIKNRYIDVVEENILSFAIILNSTTNTEIRRLLFDLIIELLRESNICQVFDVFIGDLNKLRGANDTDSNIQIKNMILNCIHQGLKRYPNTKKNYALFLFEKAILYNSKGTFIDEQICILKDLFYIFGDLRNEFIKKALQNFEEINNAQILQIVLWLVTEFIEDDIDLVKKFYMMLMKNMGDLNFEVGNEETNLNKKDLPSTVTEKKTITKTVILPDGTYGTQQIYLESSEVNKQKDNKFLRNFILETDFFFSTNLVMTLTRLVIKINKFDQSEQKETYNTFFFNTINIICAILKIKSNKIFKDPHNISRINFCLECLINNELDLFLSIINESREVYNEYYSKLLIEEDSNISNKNKFKNMIKSVDDYLSFRYVKNAELDGIDAEEDKIEEEKSNKQIDTKDNKYIEVITGSEDPLLIEAVVEVFTFDISVDFVVKNQTKSEIHNISLNIFVPENLQIIEQPPSITLAPNESKKVRCCIKFSSTCNCYIFGQVSFANNKGHTSSINLAGIYVDLLVKNIFNIKHTIPEEISELNFRKLWVDYNWEHSVPLISKKNTFKDVIECLINELKLKLVVPSQLNMIDEDSGFLVCNMYTKTKLGEDALINISIERSKTGKIMGSQIIRSRAKEFAQILGEKIRTTIK